MSLFENMMDKCVKMTKTSVADGEGGKTTQWTQGAEVYVAIVHDSSTDALRAEREGVTSTYTLTTHKADALNYHDVIKRLEDGRIFRVTSEKGDDVAPAVSSLNMAQVKAEKWELTN